MKFLVSFKSGTKSVLVRKYRNKEDVVFLWDSLAKCTQARKTKAEDKETSLKFKDQFFK